MGRVEILKSHLKFEDVELNNGFQRAVKTYFGEEYGTFYQKMNQNLDQLQWQFEERNPGKCDPKICLEVLKTQLKKFFDSKEVNASDHENRFFQKYFTDITRPDPQTFRTQESLVSKGATLEASLVTKGITMEDNLVVKESSSLGNDTDAEKTLVETVAFDIKNADIGPSYDSDTLSKVHHDTFENVFAHRIQNHKQPESIPDTYMVNKNTSNIISDIPNMDPVKDKEEHDYVDDEQQCAFFASLVNNLKCEVEICTKVNREV
ncbi:hypothetical protein Tco_0493845 [Tanacetum coccineum]